MLPLATSGGSVETVVHVIQVALTPVFLLSAIGTLLNVFNTRQSRVADHTEHTTELLEKATEPAEVARMAMHLRRLNRRTLALDFAIGLGALAGAMTCCAVAALFLGVLRDWASGALMVGLFGASLICTIGSLAAFFGDSVLAWHGLQQEGALPHTTARRG